MVRAIQAQISCVKLGVGDSKDPVVRGLLAAWGVAIDADKWKAASKDRLGHGFVWRHAAMFHVNEAIFCSQLDSESALLSSHFPQPSLFCLQPFHICSRSVTSFARSHFSSAAVSVIVSAAISHLQLFQFCLPGAISHLQLCQSFCQQPFLICSCFSAVCLEPFLICSHVSHFASSHLPSAILLIIFASSHVSSAAFSVISFARSDFSSAAVSVILSAAISHLQPCRSLQHFLICSRFSHFVRSHFSSAAVSVMLPAAISHLQPFQSFWQRPFLICSRFNHFGSSHLSSAAMPIIFCSRNHFFLRSFCSRCLAAVA